MLLASWRGRGVQCLAGQAGPEATQHHLQEADVADVPRGQLGIFEVCPPMLLILSMKVETLKIISSTQRTAKWALWEVEGPWQVTAVICP